MVDIEPVCELENIVSLDAVRQEEALADMLLIRRGQRLSIQPVQTSFDTSATWVALTYQTLSEVIPCNTLKQIVLSTSSTPFAMWLFPRLN